jgi:lysophospholipase L1-like esterase
MRTALYLAGSALLFATAAAARQETTPKPVAVPVAVNPATTPVARPDEWWQKRHAAMNERVKQGGVELLFIGDSITQGWEGEGAALWKERYAPRKAVNLGISADQTEHVLWRLQNGNLEGIAPKAAVIMIGTNNVGNTGGKHSAEQIAAGVKAIVAELATRAPKTKVVVLAIFPRAAPGDPKRDTIAAINALLAKQAEAELTWSFLDIGPKFLSADGTLAPEVMPDKLHLSAKGYAIWADAIEGELKRLLGEK